MQSGNTPDTKHFGGKAMKKISRILLAITFSVLLINGCAGKTQSVENNLSTQKNKEQDCIHEYEKWSITRVANCLNEGIQTRECKICGCLG